MVILFVHVKVWTCKITGWKQYLLSLLLILVLLQLIDSYVVAKRAANVGHTLRPAQKAAKATDSLEYVHNAAANEQE